MSSSATSSPKAATAASSTSDSGNCGGSPPKRAKGDESPSVQSLSSLESGLQARVGSVCSAFVSRFGRPPAFIARAPGRVNLIGEHVDYSGYAVLPMAIEQDLLIAVSPNQASKVVTLANVEARHTEKTYPARADVPVDNSVHDWGNYFLAGFKGLAEHAKLDEPTGMDCMVAGTVPQGSGLSSSSAFVVCSALATMHANGLALGKTELATLCAHAEHYVGTEGGGMDQSISLLAEAGTAKLIEFNPIRATDVRVPEGAVFVISNSCVTANKYVSAGSCFNKRVVECRCAAMILAAKLGLSNPTEFRKLGQLQEKYEGGSKSLAEMSALAEQELKEGPYTQAEMAAELGLDLDALAQTALSPSTQDQQDFYLRKRAVHVYTEAGLVWDFKDATTLEACGELMNASHTSCKVGYECSCPELDELTQLCRSLGALGSRLTGAGWGGSAVSLIRAGTEEEFLAGVKKGYYDKRPELKDRVATSLFATAPGQGASIIQG